MRKLICRLAAGKEVERSRALSFTLSTVWNGSAIRTGATRFPSRCLPSQTSSAPGREE
jgi:hypothetical protein